jgi:hypothetical protein
MSVRSLLFLVAWLTSVPCLTWGQQVASSHSQPTVSDFSKKTFEIGAPEENRTADNDYHQYFLFQPDGRAIFRGSRGNKVLKDSPLGWKLVGDSLYLQPGPIMLEAEGETQRIDRDPIKYAVTKVSGGFLLTRKQEKMLLREVK